MQNNCNNPIVTIRCWTFNHKPYIRQCLDGFVIQKTNFPYFAVVVDDTSTDGEQEVLWDFINNELDPTSLQKDETDDFVRVVAPHKTNKHCIFIIILLKYNHYSIRKAKRPYYKEWEEKTKYIAICEGDDYWTDPLKLQKQVDFMESHPDFTMVCNRAKLYSERQKKFIGENYCYNKSQVVKTKDVIYRTGVFIPTCSIVHRKTITDVIPDYWAKCKVGDYPLQIMCAMKGKVYYFNDIMSVYRVQNANSWTGQQKWGKLDKARLEVIKSQIDMFKGFAQDYPKYNKYFKRKIANNINRYVPYKQSEQDIEKYLDFFSEDIKRYGWAQKLDLWMRRKGRGRFKIYYLKYFQEKFEQRRIFYNS